MEKTIERVEGDMPGTAYGFPVYRFRGSQREDAPSAYLQAALHANELPGTAALHVLMEKLRKAEAEGRIAGDLTIVPFANPVGRSQVFNLEVQGRFDLGTRGNFNRDFPLIDRPDASLLADDAAPITADKRLKARLLALSLGHDLVLDLHCDAEGLSYFYVPKELWPQSRDLARALGSSAVLFWSDGSDGAFEEAAVHPYLQMPSEEARLVQRVVTTVEFRGIADVDPALAAEDADGLYRFLVGRGVIVDDAVAEGDWNGPAAPIENVEMMRSPAAGMIFYHVRPGDRVEEGDLLATIVTEPGEADGEIEVRAPQAGLILTRRSHRQTRRGDDLLKLIGSKPAVALQSGTLEE
ncbi:ectoine utilization protein EutE [Hartmannibacter diazotrophicus]|uniref:Ectoine utilization protein EutE n=1 Tax=Hartmannibacter diazotrophicus TaxID=1482074 RepID=A0A2C9D8V9_9HYPH|nr:succinylglutamate desuccinylase/aspartoacylase family protein [Hartmannibacter diazotrophicus]SON56588.1 ectoine utilization protein EutE [Hartmannibacter diazotrophicus]